ncbi:MAG: hypothetical protein D6690_07125 [Nitrospirae bacterium]|nr:MAG: hypothetical protein D6690_07125 [Nitrospirota bacterium]
MYAKLPPAMPRSGSYLHRNRTVRYSDFRQGGKRHIVKIGRRLSRSVAADVARARRSSIVRAESEIKTLRYPFFEDACREFMRWAAANWKPRAFISYRACIQRHLAFFHGNQSRGISHLATKQHEQCRILANGCIRVSRDLAVDCRPFNLCAPWELSEGHNPFSVVTRLKEPPQCVRFLEPDEERLPVEAAYSPLKEPMVLAVNTGRRVRSDALALRWHDVDFSRKPLTVPAAYAKSGCTRVALNAKVFEALSALYNRTRGKIAIDKEDGSSSSNFQSQFIVERVGLADTGFSHPASYLCFLLSHGRH